MTASALELDTRPSRSTPSPQSTPGSSTASSTPSTGSSTGWFGRTALSAIRFYQRAVDGRPSPCRFTPSCSAYAVEALESHSTGRGLWLTVRRLVRCRPFGPSGYDPVPEHDHVHDHLKGN